MKTGYSLVLISVLVISGWAGNCPLDASKQPKIYSDAVGLTTQTNNNGNNTQNLVYNYQFESPFASTPNVAIGLNEIQASQSPLLDIRVSNARTTTNGIYFQAQSDEQSQWKNFKINFMASTRTDIELGSTSIKSPIVNSNDNSFNMIYNLKNDLPASGLKVKSFLQGINVYSPNKTQIGIKQQNAYINNKQIFFTFSSPLKFSIVRSLTISIIVFNIYTPSVLYADGGIDQNYVTSTTDITIPRHGINELRTYIVGINSFETSAAQPISIYSAIDETFSLVIGPIDRNQIDFVSVSYLILSIVDCGSCEGNPLLFEGICQPICPPGYRASKSRCIPIQCQQGQTLNSKGQCVTTCGRNEQYQSGTCICLDGYYRINRVCDRCPDGYYYHFKDLTCKPLCGSNSYYQNGRCYCHPGYFIINNRCQQCTYGTQYDISSQRCVNVCKVNEIYSPAGCVCINDYNRINGVCSRCPYMQIYDPDLKACICKQGLQLLYGSCVPACSRTEVRVNGDCLCASGYYRVNGTCSKCGPNSSYNVVLERCFCDQYFYQVYGQCIPNCTNQEQFINGKCIPYCKQNAEYWTGSSCECYQDYERINGICVSQCLALQVRVNGICRCITGYYKGYSPICQKVNCPAGTAWDDIRADCLSICSNNKVYINGQCVCQYGYNNQNGYGDCVANCTAYEVNVNGFCQCATGYTRIANGVCVPDKGDTGSCSNYKISIFGKCTTPVNCQSNEYWCGTACICVNGYYKVNGICVPVKPTLSCPLNSDNNGLNCLCKSGYFPTSEGACNQCTSGCYWDGYKCQTWSNGNSNNCQNSYIWDPVRGNCYPPSRNCQSNQEWDGANCRCRQGYYWINNLCQQCPQGTVFDGYKCSAGTTTKYCRDPYSFWNGYGCVCMPGYWALADGKCVSCPEHTYWDGTCCKPQTSQYIPLTASY